MIDEKNSPRLVGGYGNAGAELLAAKFLELNPDRFATWLNEQGFGGSSGCARWIERWKLSMKRLAVVAKPSQRTDRGPV